MPFSGSACGGGEKKAGAAAAGRCGGSWTVRRRARLALAAVEGGGKGARAGEVGDGTRAPRRKKKAAAAIGFISIAAAMNRRPARPRPAQAACGWFLNSRRAWALHAAAACAPGPAHAAACAAACSHYFFENN